MVDSSKPHIALLFVFRAFYALGFFELFDLLHHLRPINLLVFIVLVNCIIYGRMGSNYNRTYIQMLKTNKG